MALGILLDKDGKARLDSSGREIWADPSTDCCANCCCNAPAILVAISGNTLCGCPLQFTLATAPPFPFPAGPFCATISPPTVVGGPSNCNYSVAGSINGNWCAARLAVGSCQYKGTITGITLTAYNDPARPGQRGDCLSNAAAIATTADLTVTVDGTTGLLGSMSVIQRGTDPYTGIAVIVEYFVSVGDATTLLCAAPGGNNCPPVPRTVANQVSSIAPGCSCLTLGDLFPSNGDGSAILTPTCTPC